MTSDHYPIVGISAGKGPNGEVPIRQEINAWSRNRKNKNQLVLFLKALRIFQDILPDQRDSYFQIAGIHGMPYKPWDEAATEKKGYCAHASPLFLPWHRQYLLLFEQRLYEIMINDIIPKYPPEDQPTIRAAADTWRLPYWDWATNPEVPVLATQPERQIDIGGELETIKMPLFKFRMPTGNEMASEGVGDVVFPENGTVLSYGKCIATSRHPSEDQRDPNSTTWIDGVVRTGDSDKYMVEQSVNGSKYSTSAEVVYRLITGRLGYPDFSNMATDSSNPRETDMNIEYISNNIHLWAGGEAGHISQHPVASFDPLYWLHYCNIDRLWAVWQELNPDKRIESQENALSPFHKDNEGTVWMAEDTWDFKSMGYTYPELQPWLPRYQSGGAFDEDKYSAGITTEITTKYGISRSEALYMVESARNRTGKPLPEGLREISGGIVVGNDFALSIRYAKFAFGGSPFNIEIFLEPADGSGRHFTPEEFVTNVYNFSSPGIVNGEEVCTNCTTLEKQKLKVAAYFPLTSLLTRLIREGKLESLSQDDVETALKRLYWRVTMAGQPVPEEQLAKLRLQIHVLMGEVIHSNDASIPSEIDTDPEPIPGLGIEPEPEIEEPKEPEIPEKEPEKPEEKVPEEKEPEEKEPEKIPEPPSLTIGPPMKLTSEVSPGGSITVESSSLDLTRPDSRDLNRIVFIHFDDTVSTLDIDNFDVLVCVNIIRRPPRIQLQTKPANHGWDRLNMINFPDWLQASTSLKIRVDVQTDSYEVFLNDNFIQSVPKKYGNKSITHVQYEASMEPFALSRELKVTPNVI